MTEFLYSHPLLRLIAVGILGIAIGDAMQASPLLESHNISITTLSGYALMLCLFCAAIFRRYEKIASIAIICAMFTLGIFLIKSERHTLCFGDRTDDGRKAHGTLQHLSSARFDR